MCRFVKADDLYLFKRFIAIGEIIIVREFTLVAFLHQHFRKTAKEHPHILAHMRKYRIYVHDGSLAWYFNDSHLFNAGSVFKYSMYNFINSTGGSAFTATNQQMVRRNHHNIATFK